MLIFIIIILLVIIHLVFFFLNHYNKSIDNKIDEVVPEINQARENLITMFGNIDMELKKEKEDELVIINHHLRKGRNKINDFDRLVILTEEKPIIKITKINRNHCKK